MNASPKSMRARLRWYREALSRRLNSLLVTFGPQAFIAFHWPWPRRKPWMRPALVIQPLGGGLGDELMCLPIFEEIKRRNPRCHISFVVRRPDFFRGQPFVDEVLDKAPARGVITLVYNYVLPPPRPLMSLMAECVGISAQFPRIPPLRLSPSATAKNHLEGISRPLVVIQPLSSAWTTNKNWPIPYWTECAQLLARQFHVLEVGTEPVLQTGQIGPNFSSLAGKTSLEDLAYIVSKASLFIGPSSSGMHLANASGIPALIIFGGYESPAGYDFSNVHPLYNPVPCAPCWRQTCPYDLKCLRGIQPAEVVQQALRILTTSPNFHSSEDPVQS